MSGSLESLMSMGSFGSLESLVLILTGVMEIRVKVTLVTPSEPGDSSLSSCPGPDHFIVPVPKIPPVTLNPLTLVTLPH